MKLFKEGIPFYKANLHVHTTKSDGQRTPEEVRKIYRNAGYDILAHTDHWYVADDEGIENGMLLLRGVEFDTNYGNEMIHMLAIGLPEGTNAETARFMTDQERINWIRSIGGRVILAHPAWSLNTPDRVASLKNFSAVEVYNSVSGAPWNARRADSSNILDMFFTAKQFTLPFVASDDTHWYTGEECMSYTMIQARSLTTQGILEALDDGLFYATQGPSFTNIEIDSGKIHVTCSAVNKILFVSNTLWSPQRCHMGEALTEAWYNIEPNDRYIRIELEGKDGKLAWSSPIVIK